ncbi:MAG TPA: hypothetical protein VGP35_03640 [Terriglobales bacterium]|jgi:hypothetical protein|nr:hypothetical protein [Terriglobales bacterium]
MTTRTMQFRKLANLALLLVATSASAQWVMVARAVSGRVQQMSHKPANGPGYDVATVVLEAKADKVYTTALSSLKTHPGITVTKNNDQQRKIEFTNGQQYASLQATSLGDKITQLVIASTLTSSEPSATSLVVQGVMKVCGELKVECKLVGD